MPPDPTPDESNRPRADSQRSPVSAPPSLHRTTWSLVAVAAGAALLAAMAVVAQAPMWLVIGLGALAGLAVAPVLVLAAVRVLGRRGSPASEQRPASAAQALLSHAGPSDRASDSMRSPSPSGSPTVSLPGLAPHITAMLSEHLSGAVAVVDAEGRLAWVNEAFERLTDLPYASVAGRCPADTLPVAPLHADEARAALAGWRAAVQAGRPWRGEWPLRTSVGQVRWIEFQLQPLHDAARQAAGAIAFAGDVSAAHAERECHEGQRQRLLALFGGARLFVLEWQVSDDSLSLDPRLLQHLGYADGEPGPQSMRRWIELGHIEDMPAAWTGMKQHFDGATAHFEHRIRVRHQDGRWLWLAGSGSVARRNADGLPLVVTAVYVDIAAALAETDALRESLAAAQAAHRTQSAFVSAVSQEMRQPLSGVVGMAERLIGAKGLSADDRAAARGLHESVSQLMAMLDDVVDLARIEAGRFELENNDIDLTPLVEGVCDQLAPLAAARDVHLEVFVLPDGSERVRGDASRLRQVLSTLISHAILHGQGRPGRAGRVRVRVSRATAPKGPSDVAPSGVPALRDAALVCFEVQDNGVGMDAEAIERLFTPFASTTPPSARRTGSTGLGLAISHRLIERMGGHIEVASRLGEGSTLRAWLPLLPGPAQPAQSGPSLAGVRCVLVESPDLPVVDLKAWLTHAGALVQRCVSIHGVRDAARRLRGIDASSGADEPIVVIQDDSADPKRPLGDATDADESDRAAGLPENLRHLFVGRGRRSSARQVAPHVAQIDVLRRQAFGQAVALLAGRAKPGRPTAPQPGDDLLLGARVAPPTIEQALERGQLILVAENDPTHRAVLVRQLGLLGYAAELVDSGPAALRSWQQTRHALVLCDLRLPAMDGFGLAEEMRRLERQNGWSRTPLVALSGQATKAEARRSRASGLDDYLTQPVPLKLLQACLNQWMPAPKRRTPGQHGAGDIGFVPIGTPTSDWARLPFDPHGGEAAGGTLTSSPTMPALPAWPVLPALPGPAGDAESRSAPATDHGGPVQQPPTAARPTLAPAGADADDPVLNLRLLRELVGEDEQTVRELLLDFLQTVGRQALELRDTYRRGDLERASTLAQQLRTAARAVGAQELGEVCAAMARADAADDASRRQGRIEWFDQAFSAVCGRIEAALRPAGT
jgi:PAS domain S-box-containing protein